MPEKDPKRAVTPSRKRSGRRIPPSTAPIFDFSSEEIDRAINVFAEFHQDHPMEREMMRIKTYALLGELQKRGLTRALGERLIDELVRAGAYFKGRQFVNLRTWVPLNGGPQIDTGSQDFWYLYSTRSRLRQFFAKRGSASGRTTVNEFRRKGEFWELTYQWKTVYIGDAVGLAYIAQLLRDPGRQVPVAFLQAAKSGIDPIAVSGSSGELLDAEARQQYWNRCEDLRIELDAARAGNDVGQVEALQNELDQITNQLLSASGLGGRSREGSESERARKAVSQAISRAIDRIGDHHQALRQHLLNSIASGRTFCYSPDAPVEWLL